MKTTITSTDIFTTDIAQTEIVNTDISSNIITTKGETGSISLSFVLPQNICYLLQRLAQHFQYTINSVYFQNYFCIGLFIYDS